MRPGTQICFLCQIGYLENWSLFLVEICLDLYMCPLPHSKISDHGKKRLVRLKYFFFKLWHAKRHIYKIIYFTRIWVYLFLFQTKVLKIAIQKYNVLHARSQKIFPGDVLWLFCLSEVRGYFTLLTTIYSHFKTSNINCI